MEALVDFIPRRMNRASDKLPQYNVRMFACRARCIGILAFWAAALPLFAAEIPRPEYPEPQFERSAWMSLNGTWDFGFDDQREGLAKHWNAADFRLAKH